MVAAGPAAACAGRRDLGDFLRLLLLVDLWLEACPPGHGLRAVADRAGGTGDGATDGLDAPIGAGWIHAASGRLWLESGLGRPARSCPRPSRLRRDPGQLVYATHWQSHAP